MIDRTNVRIAVIKSIGSITFGALTVKAYDKDAPQKDKAYIIVESQSNDLFDTKCKNISDQQLVLEIVHHVTSNYGTIGVETIKESIDSSLTIDSINTNLTAPLICSQFLETNTTDLYEFDGTEHIYRLRVTYSFIVNK